MAVNLIKEDINDMLKPFGEVEIETGIFRDKDGNWCIHMLSPMPCATGYRMNWWTSRGMSLEGNFQRWNPREHIAPLPPEKLKDINDPEQWYPNMFYNTTNHAIQEMGGQRQEIHNHYYYPEEFGFDISRFEDAGVTGCNCTSPENEDCPLYGQQLIHVMLETDYGCVRRTWLSKDIVKGKCEILDVLTSAGFCYPALYDGRLQFHHEADSSIFFLVNCD